MSHYFSAFVAVSRSVTFAMQGCLKDAAGFEEWYGEWQTRLRGGPLVRFFHECRTDGQHLGICPIKGGRQPLTALATVPVAGVMGLGTRGAHCHFRAQPRHISLRT
jgi:hypothetical protein